MPSSIATKKPQSGLGRRPTMILWGAFPLLIVMVTGFLFSWHSLSDLDIWFHLRSGRDLLAGQGMTTVNHYSFAEPDHPWVNHEWMFQILAAVTGPEISSPPAGDLQPDVTGWNLLRSSLVLFLLLTLLLGDGGTARLWGRESRPFAVWSCAAVIVGLLLLWPRMTIRPELFSYLFFVLLIRWAEQFFRVSTRDAAPSPAGPAPRRHDWRAFIDPRCPGGRIVILTIVWAQFHGFVSLVPLVLLLGGILARVQIRLYPGRTLVHQPTPSFLHAAVLVGLTLISLTLTPNLWNGLLMPIRAVGQFSQSQIDLRTIVSELVPLQESPNSLGLTIMVYRASLVWGLLWIVATVGRVSLLRILVFALAGLAAWTNQRSIGIYGVAFILLHLGMDANSWRLPLVRRIPTVPTALNAVVGLTVTLLAASWLWPSIMTDDFYLREGVGRRFGSGLNPARYPVAAASEMTRLDTSRYFANLDAAGFLLAHTSGQIFIDGRTEAYSPDLWAEYIGIKRGDKKALQLLEGRRVDAICLATAGASFDRLAFGLLNSPAWDLQFAEAAGLLFRPASKNVTLDAPSGSEKDKNLLTQAGLRTLNAAEAGSSTRGADLCLAAGQLFTFAENRAKHEEAYRRGLSFKPDHPTLNHNLGNLLLDRQNFQEALHHFQVALGVNPRLAGSALNAGVCQMRLGRPDEAARFFKKAADIAPNRVEAWANLATALFRSGNRAGAIQALKKAQELKPADPLLKKRLSQWELGIPD
jgi:tetratricopeptide (TPR) repeat protein